MKSKYAAMAISKKISNWLDSITNPTLKELVSKNVIVTGGCIISLLQNEEVNDFDIYLRTKEATLGLARYYVEEFKKNPPQRFKNQNKEVKIEVVEESDRVKIVIASSGIAGESGSDDYQYFEQVEGNEEQEKFIDAALSDAKDATKTETESKQKYRPVFLTSNAITLSNKIQIVLRFYGEPKKIHSTYDFVHCTNYWDSGTKQLMLNQPALESLLAKNLVYKGCSLYPICALVRVRKFLKRGWHINAGELLKISWDISKLDLTNIKVLEDQLIGVDSAYFGQLIEALKEKDPEKVDPTYLMTVIDRIF